MSNVQKMCWKTEKNIPVDAVLPSHQLMLRAGLISKNSSGIYVLLPMGLRVLRRIESVIRQNLQKIGAEELLMPMVQSADLWQETKRWQAYGSELLRFKDRHEREFCLGPTHEEVITDWARKNINSYKQLPACFFQIQTKFRDEIRPRFGVMRAREFIMKDAYSFHVDQVCMEETYAQMYTAYCNIFKQLGFDFKVVEADSGSIGGKKSHEFQVICEHGEDYVVYSDTGEYAANLEEASAQAPGQNCSEISVFLVPGVKHDKVAVVLRSIDSLNLVKLNKHPLIKTGVNEPKKSQVNLADIDMPILVDRFAVPLVPLPSVSIADLRSVIAGDISPDGKGHLKIAKGVEVGHIFQLGDCYSKPMQACVSDCKGQSIPMQMGCYGIGVSRILAALIEQHHDSAGIVWPKTVAPFDIHIIAFAGHKNPEVADMAKSVYEMLELVGYEVLLDDRESSPGSLLADADLIGIPWRIVVSKRSIDNGGVEIKQRRARESSIVVVDDLIESLLRA